VFEPRVRYSFSLDENFSSRLPLLIFDCDTEAPKQCDRLENLQLTLGSDLYIPPLTQ
jgi:hypothetical protein